MATEVPEFSMQARDGRREETVKDILSGEEQLIPSQSHARKKNTANCKHVPHQAIYASYQHNNPNMLYKKPPPFY